MGAPKIVKSITRANRSAVRQLKQRKPTVTLLIGHDKTVLAVCLTPRAVERETLRIYEAKQPGYDQFECVDFEVLS